MQETLTHALDANALSSGAHTEHLAPVAMPEQQTRQTAIELGKIALVDEVRDPADNIVTTGGSLEPTWQTRARAAHDGMSNPYAYVNGGDSIVKIEDVRGYQPGYTTERVVTALPVDKNNPSAAKYNNVADMPADEKLLHGVGELTGGRVTFDRLSKGTQDALFTASLMEVEALSRDVAKRQEAVSKNLERMREGVVAKDTDYVHGFALGATRNILKSGLAAGEGVGTINGRLPSVDTEPFNLDLVSLQEIGGADALKGRGHSFGQALAIVDRSETSSGIDIGNEMTGPAGIDGHKMIFGGLPSTDIRAIKLFHESANGAVHEDHVASSIINDIVAEGLYVPVYDASDRLLLTYNDFVDKRKTGNYIDDLSREPQTAEQVQDMRKAQEQKQADIWASDGGGLIL